MSPPRYSQPATGEPQWRLSAKLKALHGDEARTRAAYDDFLANLSAE